MTVPEGDRLSTSPENTREGALGGSGMPALRSGLRAAAQILGTGSLVSSGVRSPHVRTLSPRWLHARPGVRFAQFRCENPALPGHHGEVSILIRAAMRSRPRSRTASSRTNSAGAEDVFFSVVVRTHTSPRCAVCVSAVQFLLCRRRECRCSPPAPGRADRSSWTGPWCLPAT